ncbi:hypothetical protein [Pseudomonas sp. OB66]
MAVSPVVSRETVEQVPPRPAPGQPTRQGVARPSGMTGVSIGCDDD